MTVRGLIALWLLAACEVSAQQLVTNGRPMRAVNAATQPKSQDIGGFRSPSYGKDGAMTSQIFGDFAHVMPNGYVDITGLRVEFYKTDEVTSNRLVNMTVTSPKCVYHRERRTAASKDDVRIVRDDMVITGKGFIWENEQEVMQILHDSKVVLKNARRDMKEGIKP